MARRGGTYAVRCQHEGCRETGHYAYDIQREYCELLATPRYEDWRCTRHTKPEDVLSPGGNPARTVVLICTEKCQTRPGGERVPYGRFWAEEGSDTVGSGFNYSSAHKAWAEDFPPGTRLVLTAHVELPEVHRTTGEQL